MDRKRLEELVIQIENYLECWKQFNHYLALARTKKFSQEDEVHALVGGAPSLRYLSELNDGMLRNLENQWHKIYIGWQSILGQLKVQQRQTESKSAWSNFFGKKKT